MPAALIVAAAIGACGGPPRSEVYPAPAPPRPAPRADSNAFTQDYAGSRVCATCHADVAARFLASPMHGMTRDAKTARIQAPFDGRIFELKGDTARLVQRDGERFLELHSKRSGDKTFRITKVIGGRVREDFVGRPTSGGEEMVLPVSWLVDKKRLRYKGYSVMVRERPGLVEGPVWGQTCIFCHNTVPYAYTALGALAAGAGAPTKAYQGVVVDALLPTERRARYAVTDERALAADLDAEMARLGAPALAGGAGERLRGAIDATRARFRAEHLVEIGIGCESCHNGAAAHAANPAEKPSLAPKAKGFSVDPPREESTRAAAVNRVCARCHQVLFSGYEHTWEGGKRNAGAGGSNINSGEARDMILGACRTQLACTSCHDPHAEKALERSAGSNAVCTGCHRPLADPSAVAAHTHHPPGAGSECVGCHMPKKNMSLDGRLSRYHRIGSPTEPAKVMLDRPLECALCHGDKTVRSLVDTMERWWPKRSYDRAAIARLYGGEDENVLLATARLGKPHERAVAFALLGEAKRADALPLLRQGLEHDYPIVQGYAADAIEAITPRPPP